MPFPAGSCTQHSYFIIHPAVFETSIVTNLGGSFTYFSPKSCFISCGSGLSAAAVFQLFPFTGHSTRIPPSTGVYTGTRKLCLAQCSACRPMRSRSRRKGHPPPAGGRWTQNAPGSDGCDPLPAHRLQGSGRFLPLIWYTRYGWACVRGHAAAMMLSTWRPMGASITPGPSGSSPSTTA